MAREVKCRRRQTSKSVLRHLPPRTTFIGRIRKDAKLHLPLPERDGACASKFARHGSLLVSYPGFPFWNPGLRPVYTPPASPCVTFSSIAAPAPSQCTASQISRWDSQHGRASPLGTAPQPALFEHSSLPVTYPANMCRF